MLRAVRYALDLLSAFKEETGHDPGLHRSGSLMLALSDERMRSYEEQVAKACSEGIEANFLTDTEIRKLAPSINLTLLKGGYFVPGDGYLDPSICAQAYAAAATDLGVNIVSNARVTDILTVGDEVQGVEIQGKRFDASRVVVTAGPWSALLAKECGCTLPVQPIRHQRVVTRPSKTIPEHFPVVRVTDLSCYLRRELGGYLYGFFESSPKTVNLNLYPSEFATDHVQPPIETMAEATRRLSPIFPDLQGLPISERHQGITTFAPDGAYVIGPHPAVSNLFFASGCAALGIAGSAAIGKWLTEYVTIGQTEDSVQMFSPSRFGERTADMDWIRVESKRFYANYYAI